MAQKRKKFHKGKIFAYENSEGDKGIICAMSYEEAVKLFYQKYPNRKIMDPLDRDKSVPVHGYDELKALAVSSTCSSDDRHPACSDDCYVPVRELRCIQRYGT